MGQHVCFLITEHPFLDARIFKKEAKSLYQQGYKVTMIVPTQNGYLFDVDGRLFVERFRSPSFVHDGIHIITYEQMQLESELKQLHHHLQDKVGRHVTDPLTQLGIAQQADIYHAHEFFSLYAGVRIKRALTAQGRRCRLIYDSHELEPDPLVMEAQTTKRLKHDMLAMMLKETDHVITVSPSIQSYHQAIAPNIPVDVIYNAPPRAVNCQPGQGQNEALVMVFEGMIDAQRGSFQKLMDIVTLANKYMELNVRIIGGEKQTNLKQDLLIPSSIADKVDLRGWVNYESIPEAMAGADIGWIDLDAERSLNNRYAMPNKFFSYLNSGLPVLVNQCDDMVCFIETYDCGYVVKKRQADAAGYVQALLHLHDNRRRIAEMSRHALRMMQTTFSWEHMERKLGDVYKQLEA